ncbi:MAG TPA: hypothetical protein VHH90_09575 [Polyangia bacterium]|nr:hypothetical protein [Polyangia bacterium]
MLGRRARCLVAGAAAGVAVLAGGGRPARGDCRIRLSHADLPAVTVRAGARSWPVRVEGADGSLSPEPGGPLMTAQLTAPLAFHGTVEARAVRLAAKRPVDLFDGRVRIGRHAIRRWTATEGGIQLVLADTLGLSLDAPALVPCADLRIVNDGLESASSVAVEPRAKGAASLAPGQIQLFTAPERGSPLRIAFAGQVGVVARRRGWAEIETRWDDGSRLRGWVREADVDPRPGAAGGSGGAADTPGATGCSDADPFTPIEIRKGAEIADGPGGTVWAHLADSVPAQALPSSGPNPTWVRIGSLKGLPATKCDPHQFVWVRAADVVSAGRRAAAERAAPRR